MPDHTRDLLMSSSLVIAVPTDNIIMKAPWRQSTLKDVVAFTSGKGSEDSSPEQIATRVGCLTVSSGLRVPAAYDLRSSAP